MRFKSDRQRKAVMAKLNSNRKESKLIIYPKGVVDTPQTARPIKEDLLPKLNKKSPWSGHAKYSEDAKKSGFSVGSKDWNIYVKERGRGGSHTDGLDAVQEYHTEKKTPAEKAESPEVEIAYKVINPKYHDKLTQLLESGKTPEQAVRIITTEKIGPQRKTP